MKTKLWAILLMGLTTLLTSTAQIFYKLGTNTLNLSFQGIFLNYNLIMGLCIYAVAAVLMIISFKGGELSVLYPIIATSYIWVGLFSLGIFKESINALHWTGIMAIFFGVILVGIGSKVSA